MKYLFSLLLLVSIFSCQKKEDPCEMRQYTSVIEPSPLVFSFIDVDSTNLLLNKGIDTTQILIKDDKGVNLAFTTFLDSTGTKVRYISVPLLKKPGTNILTITAKNKVSILKYDFNTVTEPCNVHSYHDNYTLNDQPFGLKPRRDYLIRGNNKTDVIFRVIYIKE